MAHFRAAMHDRFPEDERYAPRMCSGSTASEVFVPEEELQPAYWENRVAELRAWHSGSAALEREPEEPLFASQGMFGTGSADMTAVPQPLAGNSDAPQHPNDAPQPLEDMFAGNTAGAPLAPEPEQYIPAPDEAFPQDGNKPVKMGTGLDFAPHNAEPLDVGQPWAEDLDVDWEQFVQETFQEAPNGFVPQADENMPDDMGIVAEEMPVAWEQLPQEQEVARPFDGYALPDGYMPVDMGMPAQEIPAAVVQQDAAAPAQAPAGEQMEFVMTPSGRPIPAGVAPNRTGQIRGWKQARGHHKNRCGIEQQLRAGHVARPNCGNAKCELHKEFPETVRIWQSQTFKIKVKSDGREESVSGFYVCANESLKLATVLGEVRGDGTLDKKSKRAVCHETMALSLRRRNARQTRSLSGTAGLFGEVADCSGTHATSRAWDIASEHNAE